MQDFLQIVSDLGVHGKKIDTLFNGNVYYGAKARIFDFPLYIMTFSNRSGSNLLAEYLRNTGIWSGFWENLNADVVENQLLVTDVSNFPDYLQRLVEVHRTSTEFGFKASGAQFLMLIRWGIPRMFKGVKVIDIRRIDVIAQAVSFSIAQQTGRWASTQASNAKTPKFDYDNVRNNIHYVLQNNNKIDLTCALFSIDRISVTYEDIVKNPQYEIERIGQWAGYDLSRYEVSNTRFAPQGTELNKLFAQRFRDIISAELL